MKLLNGQSLPCAPNGQAERRAKRVRSSLKLWASSLPLRAGPLTAAGHRSLKPLAHLSEVIRRLHAQWRHHSTPDLSRQSIGVFRGAHLDKTTSGLAELTSTGGIVAE